MASLWEIHDTSNLRYDTDLGATMGDSGFGPPNVTAGFALGTTLEINSCRAGIGNCNAWTSAAVGDFGTVVTLENFLRRRRTPDQPLEWLMRLVAARRIESGACRTEEENATAPRLAAGRGFYVSSIL